MLKTILLSTTGVLATESLLAGAIVNRAPAEMIKKQKLFWISISVVYTAAALLRYGLSVYALKGVALMLALLYASISDIQTRHSPDCIAAITLAIGLAGISSIEQLMLNALIAIATFVFFMLCTIISKGKIGGADIKLVSALAFAMGKRSIFALIISLFLSVIGTPICELINRKKTGIKTEFSKMTMPMLPYFAAGYLGTFLI